MSSGMDDLREQKKYAAEIIRDADDMFESFRAAAKIFFALVGTTIAAAASLKSFFSFTADFFIQSVAAEFIFSVMAIIVLELRKVRQQRDALRPILQITKNYELLLDELRRENEELRTRVVSEQAVFAVSEEIRNFIERAKGEQDKKGEK